MSYVLPFKEGDKIIEVGGGAAPVFRPNMDVRKVEGVDIVADLNEPFPIKDEEWDCVFSKYSLEHISWRKTNQFLQEVARILKPEGTFVAIVPNTEAQMKWVLKQDEWDDNSSCILYGDNDYLENTHRVSLSPARITNLLQQTGFQDIIVIPWGELKTDMLIEAKKAVNSTSSRKHLFDKDYFNGGAKVGGYAHEGFRDFPVHNYTFQKFMELKPESVLEVGAGRGYLVKRFQDAGVPATGLEISHHCWLTRACEGIVEWDICEFPWPFKDQSFDLAISMATFEHIPEKFIVPIINELNRVSKRGLHGIDFGGNDDGFDKTHCTLRSKEWWLERLPPEQKVIDKEELEKMPHSLIHYLPEQDGLLKVNVGSFINMFHGWCNVDILDLRVFAKKECHKFIPADARNGLPFDDKSVDLLYSSHFLEHLTQDEGHKFFKELKRVMKPGGTIRLMLPDTEILVNKYINNTLSDFDEINDGAAAAATDAGKFWTLMFSGHSCCYDYKTVYNAAKSVGFNNINKMAFRQGHQQILKETIDMLPELSLYVEITA